jgi:uncharacterized protein (DUF2384 family)
MVQLAKSTSNESPVYRRVVADARELLTLSEIAEVTGVQTRSVQNWATGTTRPDGIQRDRLLELQYIVDALSDVYDSEGADIWIHRPQRMLNHQTPIDALKAGRFEEILAVIDYLAGGPKKV